MPELEGSRERERKERDRVPELEGSRERERERNEIGYPSWKAAEKIALDRPRLTDLYLVERYVLFGIFAESNA